MSEIEKLIFAAAYALELKKRMDVNEDVNEDVNGDELSAQYAITFAHGAVALYRLQRQEQDP